MKSCWNLLHRLKIRDSWNLYLSTSLSAGYAPATNCTTSNRTVGPRAGHVSSVVARRSVSRAIRRQWTPCAASAVWASGTSRSRPGGRRWASPTATASGLVFRMCAPVNVPRTRKILTRSCDGRQIWTKHVQRLGFSRQSWLGSDFITLDTLLRKSVALFHFMYKTSKQKLASPVRFFRSKAENGPSWVFFWERARERDTREKQVMWGFLFFVKIQNCFRCLKEPACRGKSVRG